jgi:hypothetical protein
MTRKLILFSILALSLLAPATAWAGLPPGFIGISPQSPSSREDFELMRKAGIESVRLHLNWASVESESPLWVERDWDGFDHEVELAAESGLRAMPFVIGSPDWVAPTPIDLPVRSAWQRWAWASFLRAAVNRYGPQGLFWEEHPDLTFLPIRRWEIWNEENIVTFTHRPDPVRFATLIRTTGRVLHRVDPGAKVILGGLFGRPL